MANCQLESKRALKNTSKKDIWKKTNNRAVDIHRLQARQDKDKKHTYKKQWTCNVVLNPSVIQCLHSASAVEEQTLPAMCQRRYSISLTFVGDFLFPAAAPVSQEHLSTATHPTSGSKFNSTYQSHDQQ